MDDPLILIVGAADTGRAPMAAAILRRLLQRHGLRARVESAGVVGHDGDPAEPEARDAMLAMGLDISAHTARSLSDELAAEALLLLAVEAGVARVLRGRYPQAEVLTLGGLAGRPRDIPDPFRMQVGAWMQYAGEIETLLGAGLPRLRALLDRAPSELATSVAAPGPVPPTETAAAPPAEAAGSSAPPVDATSSGTAAAAPVYAAERQEAVERLIRLLNLVAELPDVVEWNSASRQIGSDLAACERSLTPDDLVRPYVALVRAMLASMPARPSPARAVALRTGISRLKAPVGVAELEALSVELAEFGM